MVSTACRAPARLTEATETPTLCCIIPVFISHTTAALSSNACILDDIFAEYRKDHPLSEKEAITIEDVSDVPLICSHQGLKDDLLEWFGEAKKDLNIVATYDMLFNASIMVTEGLGCAICLDKLIYTGNDSRLCFRPLSPHTPSPLYIIWKKYQVFTPAAKMLLDELKGDLM